MSALATGKHAARSSGGESSRRQYPEHRGAKVLRRGVQVGKPTGVLVPPLKWAGGKRWIVPHLMPLWRRQGGARLVEPFVGGLAVTLGLGPSRALLNDLNPHLIAFYRRLKRGLNIRRVRVRLKNSRSTFERNRKRFNDLIAQHKEGTAEAATLFYYLNRTCYNGLCRFNSSGFFNVPFGRYKRIMYRDSFFEFRDPLSVCELTSVDFEALTLRPTDFVYADPPYDVPFTSYSAGGFSWDDQQRLAYWLAQHSGPVVASNQATPRILRLYKGLGFDVRTLLAPRRISCDGNRDGAREMLATRGTGPRR